MTEETLQKANSINYAIHNLEKQIDILKSSKFEVKKVICKDTSNYMENETTVYIPEEFRTKVKEQLTITLNEELVKLKIQLEEL